jgi:aspartate dehydrogenase
MKNYRVAIAGLGSIGLKVARTLDQGAIPGLTLTAVSARDHDKAERTLASFKSKPALVALDALPDHAEVVVECIPAAHFKTVAEATISKGKLFMPLSVGQMLANMHLVERAKETGARIIVPTGALLGLDAVRACAEEEVYSVKILTRKPPAGLKGAPHLVRNNIDVDGLTSALRVFEGSARDAIIGFPANVNVAVALSLAGIGPDRTRIEIWADPAVTRNTHTIEVKSAASDLTMTIANIPSPETPATGKITALSVIAALRRLTAPLVVGT